MKPAGWWAAIISGAVALLALGLFAFGAKPWRWILNNEEIVVAVAEAKLESRPIIWRISGALQPAVEVDVVPRIAGRLIEVKFQTGDTVTAGAVVASVFSGDLTERVRLVETEL